MDPLFDTQEQEHFVVEVEGELWIRHPDQVDAPEVIEIQIIKV